MSALHSLRGELPELQDAVLVLHFSGWIDASGAAAAAMAAVDRGLGGTRLLATFDSDRLIDFRARRPVMEIRDGVNTSLTWDEIELRHGTDQAGREVVLLSGPEPDMVWHAFAADVSQLVARLGVTAAVALGAYPFATPHTRPPQLSCTSPSAELIAPLPYDKGSVDVPAGISSVLEHSLTEVGVPALGLWVRVPHYVATMPYPAAAVALLRALEDATGVRVSTAELEREAEQQRRRIDQLVAGNDEHREMVRQLEALHDQAAEQASSLPGELPSADELAAEFERFLRDQAD
jgi:hypothetical protein